MHKSRENQGGAIHSALSVFTLIWGANFILAKVAIRQMDPLPFSALRFGIGGISAALIWFLWISRSRNGASYFRHANARPGAADLRRIALAALFGTVAAPWLGTEGLAATHGTRAAVWVALGPVVSALIGRFRDCETLTGSNVIGLILGVSGGLLLAFDGATSGMGYGRGDIMMLAALVLTIVELHLLQPAIHQYGALPVLAMRTAFGGMVYLAIAFPSLYTQRWELMDGITWAAILLGVRSQLESVTGFRSDPSLESVQRAW